MPRANASPCAMPQAILRPVNEPGPGAEGHRIQLDHA